MSAKLQEWIHFIEEGGGVKLLRTGLVGIAFVAIALVYNLVAFKNFNTEEAMDSAQLGRNLAEGKGYTTDYIRLNAVSLTEARVNEKLAKIQAESSGNISAQRRTALDAEQEQLKNLARLKIAQPDMANAPAYPAVLAGLMKVAPIDYQIPKKPFNTYNPELWIAVFNQLLFFLSALLVFKIASQLFDRPIAFVSAILFGATELFWRFSVSGLPIMLLLLVFLLLVWTLMRLEAAGEKASLSKVLFWAILAGGLLGIGSLTRYSFGWLIFPVLAFIILFIVAHRAKAGLAIFITFLIVISPWLGRNHAVSGNFFGTASFAVYEGTPMFPENRLDRSLDATALMEKVGVTDYVRKFMLNSRDLIENIVPRLGGSWLIFLFMASLLFPLPLKAQNRMQIFLLLCVLVLWPAYALGKSHLAYASPQINSDNLLILISPIAFIFGVALYFNFIRKITFAEPVFSYVATTAFCLVISSPLLFALMPPRVSPNAYPPYHPPLIQETASWMRPNELTMSDLPWAVAWYGNRPCLALSQTFSKDFIHLNDDVTPIHALYLSPKTTESPFLSEVVRNPQGWGRFMLECLTKNGPPAGFPLKSTPPGFLPEYFFLTDWERWSAAGMQKDQK